MEWNNPDIEEALSAETIQVTNWLSEKSSTFLSFFALVWMQIFPLHCYTFATSFFVLKQIVQEHNELTAPRAVGHISLTRCYLKANSTAQTINPIVKDWWQRSFYI